MGEYKNKTIEEYHKDYYQANKEKILAYHRKYYADTRAERLKHIKYMHDGNINGAADKRIEWRRKQKNDALTQYSNTNPPSCNFCGINDIDVLCIDHISGNGNKHRRKVFGSLSGGSNMYRWLKNNSYPEGFQTLCANCNTKKRIVNKEHHHKSTTPRRYKKTLQGNLFVTPKVGKF